VLADHVLIGRVKDGVAVWLIDLTKAAEVAGPEGLSYPGAPEFDHDDGNIVR
jgi:hypothetical protein